MNKNCFEKLRAISLLVLILHFGFFAQAQPVSSSFSNTNWRFVNPKLFGFTVADIDFFDNNRGVAVGIGNGTIAYTSDGGATWRYAAFSYTSAAGALASTAFQDVHFVSANVVYAVGSNGCMAKSTDGGANWSFVRTPLYANAKSINSVWFVNENKGYIGGQNNNTADQAPKLYFTNDGGATWDSLSAPVGGKTVVGLVNNVNSAPLTWDVTAKGKEIQRIIFVNENVGYVSGSGLGTYESIPNATSTTTCALTTTTTGSHHASLFWKFSNGSLTDYSISKERLGYNGIYNAAPNCTYKYASNSVHTQTIRAIHIVNDTTVLLFSNSNNIIIKVSTGPNSFTPNINVPGLNEIGKYQLLNAPTPPMNNSSSLGASIPAVNPAFQFSGPWGIVKASNGKLFVPVNSPTIGPENRLMTSVDTGKTWIQERWLPTGRNYSNFGGTAIDLLPSGRIIIAGQSGVIGDSIPGGQWKSNYSMPVTGTFNKMDFADCANGLAAGSAFIARTADGGKNWTEIIRSDFANLNISINSGVYAPGNPAKAYFATSVGTVYRSTDFTATTPTLDPVLANAGYQMWDVAAAGNDSVWACGYNSSTSTAQGSYVFRSVNSGNSWTTVNVFPTNPSATNYLLRHIEFPTRLVGYVSGTRDTVWKTTDGGVTWSKVPLPTPGVTPQITYTDMFALDANTVFLVGNGFPRRVIFRTTDGGSTWQDITGNAATIFPSNFNSVRFHDLNNGYVGGPGGGMLITNNGGASWRLEIAPSYVGPLSNNNIAISFAPTKVPAGTAFANRKLYVAGAFTKDIFEYGDTTKLYVSSSELMVSSCNNVSNGTVTVTATGGIAPYTYSIDGGAFQSSGTFNAISAGNHNITVKDAACGNITKTIIVPVRPAPTVSAGADVTIVEGDDATLAGTSSGTPATITWTPTASILSGATTFSPTVKPGTSTTYLMTVIDANGCTSTDNATVTVLPWCLKVMDAFTPNGDGMNDKWIVTNNGGQCATNVYVKVFNRYGNEVYVNNNYQNNWDGTYNGKPIPDGTYYYAITYKLFNGKTVLLRGDVTILR